MSLIAVLVAPPVLVPLATAAAILHVGDFAYNFQDNNGTKGDAFMQTIQPIAARVPYHTCPGNHEEADDFQQYRARFTMPGAGNEQNDNIYHSFDLVRGYCGDALCFLSQPQPTLCPNLLHHPLSPSLLPGEGACGDAFE